MLEDRLEMKVERLQTSDPAFCGEDLGVMPSGTYFPEYFSFVGDL